MDLLCPVCDISIIQNPTEYNEYVVIGRMKYDKSFYQNYIFKNVNLDEVDEILGDSITIQNKKLYYFLVGCAFIVEFDNNFITTMDIGFCYNMDDTTNIKSYLLYWIILWKSRGLTFYNINQMANRLLSDKCNMRYEHSLNQPMQFVELRINMIIGKNPKLINSFDQNKNHPLIGKNSHISNNINN